MMDFREYKGLIKETVENINQDNYWKWTVKILKNEIRLTNGYIRGQYNNNGFKDYFSIRISEEQDFVVGKDCTGESFTGLIIGTDRWSDGSAEECIETALKSAQRYFDSRY